MDLLRFQERVEQIDMVFIRRVALFAALLCMFVALASATTVHGDLSERFPSPELTEIDGVLYQRREGIKTVLFMGIDSTQEMDAARVGYRNGGQNDFVMLMVIDEGRQTVYPIHLDRDTMLDMRTMDEQGNDTGIMNLQLCLAHAFADGRQMSCEMTCEAVENLLDAPPIDYYISMNLDAIPVLNDAVGGVTVTLEQDFTAYDPTMTIGRTLKLTGQQATYFVRSRYYVGTGHNWERMTRQRAYMTAIADIVVREEQQDANYIGRLYDQLEPMLTTNMSRGAMINTAWAARNYTRAETISPTGEHMINERGFMEFHADEDALRELSIMLFYEAAQEPGTP